MKYLTSFTILFLFMSFIDEGGSQKTAFDIQGHRGCRGLMPENTIPAMLKAIDLGVTTIEMDVVISGDKKVVVSHEPWFEADITTRSDGSFIKPAEAMQLNIYRMSYDEIVKYDVGMKPHPRFPSQQKIRVVKPLLNDLIDSVELYLATKSLPGIQYNIEIKSLPAGDNRFHPVPSEFVELLMALIKEKKIEERVSIQSFDFRPLKYLHEKYPSFKTSVLIEDSDQSDFEGQINRLGYTPSVYSPNYTLVDENLVKSCHDKGMKIIPWTVNDKKQIKKLRKLGVDGIITDYPDLFKK